MASFYEYNRIIVLTVCNRQSPQIVTNLNIFISDITHHHANIIFTAIFPFFYCFIHNKIHKWIKTTKNSHNMSSTIQLHCFEKSQVD